MHMSTNNKKLQLAAVLPSFAVTSSSMVSQGFFNESRPVELVIRNIIASVLIAGIAIIAIAACIHHVKRTKQQIAGVQDNSDPNFEQAAKQVRTRGILLIVISLFVNFSVQLLGAAINSRYSLDQFTLINKVLLALVLFILFCFAANAVLSTIIERRFTKKTQSINELQQYLLSHRNNAETVASKNLFALRVIRFFTSMYSVLLAIAALAIAFLAGVLWNSTEMFALIMVFVAMEYAILAVFSRIRFSDEHLCFADDKTYISKNEYPELYALAEKAAKELGCDNKRIRIALLPDFNAGIAKVGHSYSVQLGVIMLGSLSQAEVYSVLLHEFAHVSRESKRYETEKQYNAWLHGGKNHHALSGVTEAFYRAFDMWYSMEYALFLYAASPAIEYAADRAMLRCGDARIAASALLKIKYNLLFDWERDAMPKAQLFTGDELAQHILADELCDFKKAMELRTNDWYDLFKVEIMPRNASHPIFRMRIQAFGIEEPEIINRDDSTAYTAECEKALNYADSLLYENLVKNYDYIRSNYYIEPRKTVDEWESAGKPLIAETYADVIAALRLLGRLDEALELCDRVIVALQPAAIGNALLIKGCYLLHKLDPSGIDYIYRAIDVNPNNIDEGLSQIGSFCFLTGNADAIEEYRRKAQELAQFTIDKYSKIGELRKTDKLSEEHLPGDMLNEILTYIQSIDNGTIESIYLVRKTISDDFFTSAFIIKFEDGIEDKMHDDVMDRIFAHLDTCSDWQFSLFDYNSVSGVGVEQISNSCVYKKRDIIEEYPKRT